MPDIKVRHNRRSAAIAKRSKVDEGLPIATDLSAPLIIEVRYPPKHVGSSRMFYVAIAGNPVRVVATQHGTYTKRGKSMEAWGAYYGVQENEDAALPAMPHTLKHLIDSAIPATPYQVAKIAAAVAHARIQLNKWCGLDVAA